MAFIDSIGPSAFADNGGGNFLPSDPNTFVFGADSFGMLHGPDSDWSDMSGWKTFWSSTFTPNKYKRDRDKEVQDGLVKQYKLGGDSSCEKINSTIDKMEDRLDSEAGASPGKRGGRRMQGRVLKGIEAPLNTGYKLAEDKCCEMSVCASNKDRGRPSSAEDYGNENDNGGGNGGNRGGSGSANLGDIKAELLREIQGSMLASAPQEKAGMSTSMKLGLGMGGVVILFGMGYLIFKT